VGYGLFKAAPAGLLADGEDTVYLFWSLVMVWMGLCAGSSDT